MSDAKPIGKEVVKSTAPVKVKAVVKDTTEQTIYTCPKNGHTIRS
jgi:hypothetical protein